MNRDQIFKKFPTIETENFILRQINIDRDSNVLFEDIYSDPEVTKYENMKYTELGKPGSILPSLYNLFKTWEKEYSNKSLIVWGIESKSNGYLIGNIICYFFSMGIVQLDSKLSKANWNKGIMSEVLKAIIDFLEFNDVQQIISNVEKMHLPAIRILEKLDFVESNISDQYFMKEVGFSEALTLQAFNDNFSNTNMTLFVKPYINPRAFEYFQKGNDALKHGDYLKCEQLNKKALEFQPDFVHALNGLAWAKLQSGNKESALIEFNKLLKINPNKSSGLLGRAYAHSDLKMWKEAINDLLQYLKFHSTDEESYVMLGNYYYQAKQFSESVRAYEHALKINPNNTEARQYRETVIKKHMPKSNFLVRIWNSLINTGKMK